MPAENAYHRRLPHVAGLLLIVGLGLALGWKFFSDRQPVGAEESAAIAEQGELMTQQLQDQLTKQLANQPMSAEQERIDSPTGQALLRKCLEWTEFYDNHPDESSLLNRDTACDEYSDYIDSGTAPE